MPAVNPLEITVRGLQAIILVLVCLLGPNLVEDQTNRHPATILDIRLHPQVELYAQVNASGGQFVEWCLHLVKLIVAIVSLPHQRMAFWSCPDAGLWNAPSLGSTTIAA